MRQPLLLSVGTECRQIMVRRYPEAAQTNMLDTVRRIPFLSMYPGARPYPTGMARIVVGSAYAQLNAAIVI